VLIAPLPLELPELPRRLANALGLEVGWLEPEALVEFSGPIDPGALSRSATAIGAALRAPDDAVGGLQQVDLYREDVVLRAPKLDARAAPLAGSLCGLPAADQWLPADLGRRPAAPHRYAARAHCPGGELARGARGALQGACGSRGGIYRGDEPLVYLREVY
jgi:hypothetical protein